jgi:anti-repressor protein
MSNLQVFNFENNEVRTIVEADGDIWFVAKDVCDALGHSNHNSAISRLDEDEKGVSEVYTLGGKQNMIIISDSGVYDLILTSHLDSAKPFKRWVRKEVIPSIRKTGSYSTTNKKPDIVEATNEMNRQMRLLASLGKPKDYDLGMLMFEEEMGYHPTIFLPKRHLVALIA